MAPNLCAGRALAVVACLALSAPAAAKDWKPPKTEDWIEASSAHFTLYSNASERLTRKTILQLERFRQALGRITSGMTLDSTVPTSIILFKNEPSYRPYKLDEHGKPLNVGGYFLSGPFQNFITMDASAGDYPMRTIYHEYSHAIMDATLGDLPLWLNEGLAEYYSTFKTRADSTVVEIGHVIGDHLQVLHRGSLIDWVDIFQVTPDSPTYNEGTRQGAFYAQSWLMVHYLGATDERAASLGRYLTLLRDGTDADAAMQTALGMDRKELGKRVQKYLGTGSRYIRWDLDPGEASFDVALREMESREVFFRLGDLLAHDGKGKPAALHLEAARNAGWPSASIDSALGVAAYHEDDQSAAGHFQKAVASGDAPVEAYVTLAEIRFRELGNSQRLALRTGETPDEIREIRDLLEQGIEHDGESVPALVGLARTYLLGGDASVGLGAVEKARRLRPLDLEIVHLGACLLAMDGNPGAAWTTMKRSIAPGDAAMTRRTEDCVLDGTLMAIRERLESGDADGAGRILDAALTVVDDKRVRSQLESVRQVVASGGQINIVRPAEDVPVEVAGAGEGDYHHAMRLLESGDYESALKELEAFLQGCKDDALCSVAEENAHQIRAVVTANRQIVRLNEAVELANSGNHKQAVELLRELEKNAEDETILKNVKELLRALGATPAR